MIENRYDFYLDGEIAAENMTLETAMLLAKAACETYFAQIGLEVTIKRREENETD